MMNRSLFVVLFLVITSSVNSQSLLDKLDAKKQEVESFFVPDTFIGTRISLGHSVETRKKGSLEISVRNRFWDLPQETSNSFLADKMSSRFGVDYSFSDRFTYGIGMSTLNGVVDTYGKYKLLHQQSSGGNFLSLTLVQMGSYKTKKSSLVEKRDTFKDKLAFTSQILIARKFSRKFSLQIAPTFIHRASSRFNGIDNPDPSKLKSVYNTPLNANRKAVDDHNHFAVASGLRFKTSSHSEVVAEYFYLINKLESKKTFNAVSIGYNWALKDIALQFKLTNTGKFSEDLFITQTIKNLNTRRGNLFFGFQATFFLQK